jgi:ribosomal protein L37AE/L43A
MTDTVEIPDGYHERTPVGGYSPDRPMITVIGNRIFILVAAFEALGEPAAVRCFIDGNRVAIVPTDPEHLNAYSVHGTDSRSEFSGAWLKDELERDTQPEGRFPLERDGELWVVDFAPEGGDHSEPITDGGQLTPDDTLRLTDDGLEMPKWLRGYQGTFIVKARKVDAEFETTEAGLPDVKFYDGVIAVMPDEEGDYNPEIPPGHMILTAPDQPEYCYDVVDERSQEQEVATDGGTLTVCPECDCTTIERRTTAPDGPTSDGTWYCVACGIHFEEPNKRAPKGKQNVNRGYAKHLDQMAPGDLLTNGGGRDE